MAKRPKKKSSVLEQVDERRSANEEVAAMMGIRRGPRAGQAIITEREARAIRSKGGAKNLSRRDRQRLYEKTKKASDEREAAARRRR